MCLLIVEIFLQLALRGEAKEGRVKVFKGKKRGEQKKEEAEKWRRERNDVKKSAGGRLVEGKGLPGTGGW